MAYNAEFLELTKKYNTLREQNERLMGSIKVLQATNEELTSTLKESEKKKKEYKKAFDELFINNIGNAWELYDDKKKDSMSLSDKINFFTRENNLAKIYIREKMEQKNEKYKNELEKTIDENNSLKEKLKAAEKRAADAVKVNGIGSTVKNADDMDFSSPAASKSAKENVDRKKAELESSIGGLLKRKSKTGLKGSSFVPSPEGTATISDKPKTTEHNDSVKPKMDKPQKVEEKHIPEPEPEAIEENEEEDVIGYFSTKFPAEVQNKYKKAYTDFYLAQKEKRQTEFALLQTFAETGCYTLSDVTRIQLGDKLDKEVRTTTEYNKNSQAVGFLKSQKFITQVSSDLITNTGYGRTPNIYKLTDTGKVFYMLNFKRNPKKSKFDILVKEQKSPSHGANIEKLFNALKVAGYECYQEDSQKTVDTGEASIADIVAYKNNKTYRIEYEEGNYSINQYVYKFKKCLEVSKNLIVVVPTNKAKSHVEDGINSLIREEFHGRKEFSKHGLNYYVFTLREVLAAPNIIEKTVR